jgi:hypothetical protein
LKSADALALLVVAACVLLQTVLICYVFFGR